MDVKKLSSIIQGRVVSGLAVVSDQLALRFADGSTLMIERTTRGVSAVLHEPAAPDVHELKARPTRRQRDYLDFIRNYMARYGASPAEANVADHFMVSAPSAHLMIKTLERRGFITRDRDFFGDIVPRSIRVVID
ncbi:MAG: LexA family protein [Gemmatimonadota bacterium]